MTGLARRLEKVEVGLSPTEAVAQWLEEAKEHGGYAASVEAIQTGALRNPFLSLPLLVVGGGLDRPYQGN